jgi:hypothetical protein
MAKAIDISLGSVRRIWRAHKLQPHRLRTFQARATGRPPARPVGRSAGPCGGTVERLGVSRKGTLWDLVVFMPVAYRRGRETHPKPSSLGPSRWCLPIAVIGLIFIEDC